MSNMPSKNVLVTGGAGFIGSNFVRYLLKTEPEVRVINLDALTYAGALDNLAGLPYPDRHAFVQGDICDQALVERVMREHEIDTVVHFAAETHVDRSLLEPELFVKTNVYGTLSLLDAARKYWRLEKGYGEREVRFHHISTDEVFGSLGPGDPPWTEASPYAPILPTRRLKRPATIWSGPTGTPMDCLIQSPIARIIMGHISFPRSSFP